MRSSERCPTMGDLFMISERDTVQQEHDRTRYDHALNDLYALGVIRQIDPSHEYDTIQDLVELLYELLGYTPDYFIEKWDLRSQVNAWVTELKGKND